MAYTPTNWVNDSAPAINATNLNKIETGIDEAHDDLDAATEAATAGELIRRDGSGRAKVATPSATGDIATKGYVDGLASNYATAAQGTTADSALQPTIVNAKGDILAATANDAISRLAVGANNSVLVPDSAQSTGLKWSPPGETAVNVVAASGATETLSAASVMHKVTMDQNCTFTFTSPTATGAMFSLNLIGAFTPTFPASVDWGDATPPTYSSPSLYVFSTFDGGTTWLGVQAGKAFA